MTRSANGSWTRPLIAGAVLALAGCSNPSYRDWKSNEATPQLAYDECTDEVDTTMRLRGYPLRPLAETPHHGYRQEIFATCMRRKGYSPK